MIKYDILTEKLLDGALCHVYSKGNGGNVIFYSIEDCLVFFTLFSVLVKKYDMKVVAFTIMINHYHVAVFCREAKQLSAFIRELEKIFAREYNSSRENSGSLFKRDFGRAPKTILKKAKNCVVYINNNPVAGKLTNDAVLYRWNLLAYKDNDNPFSKPLPPKRMMNRNLRYAKSLIDSAVKGGQFINYQNMRAMLSRVTADEWMSLLDYVICSYNFLDYQEAGNLFGGWDRLIIAVDSMAGGEDDMKEDWENYAYYRDIIRACRSSKVDLRGFCPEKLSETEKSSLFEMIRFKTGAPNKQIRKFLHLTP